MSNVNETVDSNKPSDSSVDNSNAPESAPASAPASAPESTSESAPCCDDSAPENAPEEKPPQMNLLEVSIDNEQVALNVIIGFLGVAQRRGVFAINESAKIFECVNKFQRQQ